MEKYRVDKELYYDFMIYKNNLLEYIMYKIYNHYYEYIISGDLIFTGSIIYDRLGLIKKKYFGDIDISINDNHIGDEITKTFLQFLGQIDLDYYRNKFNNYYKNKIPQIVDDSKNKKNLSFDNIIIVDVFRNNHPENSDDYDDIFLFSKIHTKYFGHEWNLEKIYFSFERILTINDDDRRRKQIMKFIRIFKIYLKHIDKNKFKNKKILTNIENIVNLIENPFF